MLCSTGLLEPCPYCFHKALAGCGGEALLGKPGLAEADPKNLMVPKQFQRLLLQVSLVGRMALALQGATLKYDVPKRDSVAIPLPFVGSAGTRSSPRTWTCWLPYLRSRAGIMASIGGNTML